MNQNRPPSPPAQLRVGTSGYSYAEWSETGFYPAGTPSGKMLPVYARTFPITELNYTWYQMPKADAMERMRKQIPDTFWFTAKLNRSLTHEIDPDGWRGSVRQYRDGISPLLQTGQLAAVLLQFPPAFQRVPGNRRYLAELLDELTGLPTAVEFRHVSWAVDKVFAELERRGTTLVTIDAPDLPTLFPRLDVVTNSEFFYIRFHGRNVGGWRSGNMQKQFDYDYSSAELEAWTTGIIEKMAPRTRNGYMFFNNHVRAQAPANAKKLIKQLCGRGLLDTARGSWNASSSI